MPSGLKSENFSKKAEIFSIILKRFEKYSIIPKIFSGLQMFINQTSFRFFMSGLRNLKVLKSKEVKEIKQLIEKQFGAVVEGNLVFFLNTKENKIFISNQDIGLINFNDFNVNSIGLYLGELYNNEFRPSVEGAQLIAKTQNGDIAMTTSDEAQTTTITVYLPYALHAEISG